MARNHANTKVILAVLTLLSLASCATQQYRYVPNERQTATGKQGSEAVYSALLDGASSTVRILSMGVVDLKSKEDSNTFPALHLRIALSNQSNLLWHLDAQNQLVAFPNQGEAKPVFVNSDSKSIPSLDIKPGELRTVDFYFRLPPNEESPNDLPEFEFRWQLKANDRIVQRSTHFDRVPVPERPTVLYPYDPYPYGFGWGPAWWVGPGWGGPGIGLRR